MISVKQWENGLVIPDDYYEPEYMYSDLTIVQLVAGNEISGKIFRFIGRSTGTILHSDFSDILEK